MTELINQTAADKFASWAFLELMGHRKLAGFVTETEVAGGKFLRIDVTDSDGKSLSQFYRPEAVYCITPTTETMVRAWTQNNSAAPVHRYELTFEREEPETTVDSDPLGQERNL